MGYVFFVGCSLVRLGWIQDVWLRSTGDGTYIGRGKTFLIGATVILIAMAVLFILSFKAYDDTVRQWANIEIIAGVLEIPNEIIRQREVIKSRQVVHDKLGDEVLEEKLIDDPPQIKTAINEDKDDEDGEPQKDP